MNADEAGSLPWRTVEPRPLPKVPTGIQGLDDVLHGGFPEGRTTVVSGGAGTGKTVLAMEFLCRSAAAGRPGVFVSFEEPAGMLRANALAIGLDIAALEESGKMRIVYMRVPHHAIRAGEFDIQGFLATLAGHTDSIAAENLALDAVDMLMGIFDDARREREEFCALHDWLRDRKLTALLTAKHSVERGPTYPFLDYMPDCVLQLDQRMVEEVRTRRLRVSKYRGSDFLPNEHPFLLTPRGMVMMPLSSMSLAHETWTGRVPSGNGRLDEVLGGGYLRGSCILVDGPSGAGKTTLAASFAAESCRRGEKVLYVDFEDSREALLAEMRSIGIDLAPHIDDETLRVLTSLPESAGAEQHLLDILEAMDAFTPGHLIVDAISACERMGSAQAAFDFLVRLLTVCRKRGVTCYYTNQLEVLRGAAQLGRRRISSLMDTLISLEYVEGPAGLSRSLLVVKSRGAAHSMRYHAFRIGGGGIELDEPGGSDEGDAHDR